MNRSKIKVLIIECDYKNYITIKDYLVNVKTSAYQIDWVKGCQDAFYSISQKEHDVYLIDCELGKNNGIEIMKQCINSGIIIPFIVLSKTNDFNCDVQAMSAGASYFLSKPDWNPESMERAIRYAINRKKTELDLINLNTTKDKLFSIISHDLRSPVSTVMSTLEMLVNDGDDIETEIHYQMLFELYKSSKWTFNLLENLLFWSRSQLGIVNLIKENTNISLLVNGIIQMFSSQAKLKTIQVSNEIPGNISLMVDPNQIKFVFRNLISNSIKFTPDSGTIIIGAVDSQKEIMVFVKDTGVGIDEIMMESIFDPQLFRSLPGTNREPGSGLGLKIAREFVEKSQGKFWIETQVDIGTTVFFTVPKK